ncbi:MAG: hypothetical protein JJ992_19115, partial [Planctomycetes bacterium]|nr:hypothetical protein [Planctomycetota bacterium]
MPRVNARHAMTAIRATVATILILITPLAAAQGAEDRYSGVVAVSDVDGNGYEDHAVVKWHPGRNKYFVYITDGLTGNYIDRYNFSGFEVRDILGIDDVNGNGQREVAVLRLNQDGAVIVDVRDAASGERLNNTWVAGKVQKPKAMATVRDISGNDADEYAVLFNNKNTKASQVRIRDGRTGNFVNLVDVYDGRIKAQRLATLPSLDLNTNDELAILGTDTRNGQVRVRVLDSLTGQSINDLIFLPDATTRAHGMAVVGDSDGNGAAEIAVLYVQKDKGEIRVLIKDALTGAEINDKQYFDKGFTPLDIVAVESIDGKGRAGIAVMAQADNGKVKVKISEAGSGEFVGASTYHDRRFRAEQLIQLSDLDQDGVGELALLFTRKSNGTARIRIRNPVDGKNLINTP